MWNTRSVQGRRQRPRFGASWDFKDDVMLNGIVAPDQEAEPCVSDWIFRSAWTSGIRPHRAGRENSHRLFTRRRTALCWTRSLGSKGSRKFGSYRSNPPAKAPGAAMMVNRVKYLGPELKVKKLARLPKSAPDARRGRRKTHVFGEPISVRKSLSCVKSEARAWSERSGWIRIDRDIWKAIFEVQAPIRSSRSKVPRREERRNE